MKKDLVFTQILANIIKIKRILSEKEFFNMINFLNANQIIPIIPDGKESIMLINYIKDLLGNTRKVFIEKVKL